MHSNGMPVEPTDNYKILSNHLILSSIFEIGKMVFSNRCSSQFGNHHAKNNYYSHFESIYIQDPSTSKIHKSVIPWYHKKQLNPDTILEPSWKPNVKLANEKMNQLQQNGPFQWTSVNLFTIVYVKKLILTISPSKFVLVL